MAQVLGLITVTWNGANVPVEKGGTVELGGLQQKGVTVGRQRDYANEWRESKVQATSRLKRGDALLAIFTAGFGELQVSCDTGQSYTWPDAFLTKRPGFTAGDGGKVKFEWEAGEPLEVLNG